MALKVSSVSHSMLENSNVQCIELKQIPEKSKYTSKAIAIENMIAMLLMDPKAEYFWMFCNINLIKIQHKFI